jgi:hypothetical protein
MEHMTSNVYANTHSNNTTAQQKNAIDKNVNNAKGLQVHGPVHVVLNTESMKQSLKHMSNGNKREKLQMTWEECTTNSTI